MESSAYQICNADNYNHNLVITPDIVFNKYILLINDYINTYNEKLADKKYRFSDNIMKNGFETISHVFKILLLYTNNIDLTFHHCQRSFVYYIEFVEQIKDDECAFLNLTSKDAILFVYKKTIYDIPDSFKAQFVQSNETNTLFNKLDLLINIHKFVIYNYISSVNIHSDNIYKDKLIKNTSINLLNLSIHNLELSNTFHSFLYNKPIPHDKFQEIFIHFNKKLSTTGDDMKFKHTILSNMRLSRFDTHISTNSSIKLVNWLFAA